MLGNDGRLISIHLDEKMIALIGKDRLKSQPRYA